MGKQNGGDASVLTPDISKVPVPDTAGTGAPAPNAQKIAPNSVVSSSGVIKNTGANDPFASLGASIENHNGFDILKFNISPGASVITNQDTMSYMDGGLSTNATIGSTGIFGAFFRGITGASMLQNAVMNPTQNILKMVLSPLMQGSVLKVDIKTGESWRFADKSFIACTPNLNVSGNINIFSNFRMMFVGENLTYTTVESTGTEGAVWISAYGAVEKHDIMMGSGSSVPLFINNGCFLGMLDHDSQRNYWNDYVSVGTAGGIFNAMFTQLGWVMKIQDSVPPKGQVKCTVLTQSLNPHNLEKYITAIVKANIPAKETRSSESMFGSFGSSSTAAAPAPAPAVALPNMSSLSAPFATQSANQSSFFGGSRRKSKGRKAVTRRHR